MVMDIAGNIIAPNKEDTGVLATVRRAAAYPLQNNPLRAADQFVQNKAVTPFQQAFVPESKPYDPNVGILENAKNILTPVNIASGIGSMIGFLAPGGLVEGGVRTGAETLAKKAASSKLLAGAATKVANMSKKGLIAAIGGITEGSTEAVNVYDDILNNGGDEGQAALAAAKTFAWNVPIVGVTTPVSLAWNFVGVSDRICTLIDAQKGNVYAGVYRWDRTTLTTEKEIYIAPRTEVLDTLEREGQPVVFCGDGSLKGRRDIEGRSPLFRMAPPTMVIPRAGSVALAANVRFAAGDYDDCMTLTPSYLRRSEAEVLWEKRHGGAPCQ